MSDLAELVHLSQLPTDIKAMGVPPILAMLQMQRSSLGKACVAHIRATEPELAPTEEDRLVVTFHGLAASAPGRRPVLTRRGLTASEFLARFIARRAHLHVAKTGIEREWMFAACCCGWRHRVPRHQIASASIVVDEAKTHLARYGATPAIVAE